ncbi:MAG: SymE family type I addiction module toxin [Gammaproteobacteria bacterium]
MELPTKVSAPLKSRRLKVSYRQPQSRSTEPFKPYLQPMPYVRLLGRWLDEAGFAIGRDIRVEVNAGKLVLEVIEPESMQELKS